METISIVALVFPFFGLTAFGQVAQLGIELAALKDDSSKNGAVGP